MNFEFSEPEQRFIDRVRAFIAREAEKNYADEVMAPEREAHSQLADSPERREFCRQLAAEGLLGLSWPKEYGGQELPGIYDYFVNEELAAVGAPLIGKGIGIIGQTLIEKGTEKQKQYFLPKILAGEIEFALGYTEPGAGSDLASLQLKAQRDGDGFRLNGQKTFNTSAHFADWYWLAARTDNSGPSKYHGITLFLIPMDSKGISVSEIETMACHRTNEVFFDDVRVSAADVVGEVDKGWELMCQALDYERFTLFTYSPLRLKFDALVATLRDWKVAGQAALETDHVRRKLARLGSKLEVAKMHQRRVICAAAEGRVPTVESAMCKLYCTELGQEICDTAMDLLGPQALLSEGVDEAPLDGRWESALRATVVDTIGGGSSQVQKNIISRRHLGLPNPN
ncbi:acyl-CoA dehydrogenase [Pseudomaricurvus alkylphenolicus]|jgi:alkylation response protein AidB-like acyl-CoA dehydrogenase|uniref:acyl-CoA dehydrogenase family protein n=1 Tax=Pseudomaricurvus alkylphenolicus TaxID=1306991 RepID=UPI00141EBC2C|nr:acyl-CoA dehydrogenase family protein [Pseudomaricurvus alkylphenolicus]NIB38968.1 acyl-CoA dehydrogenase [Pseudomaricurvus alkylphenolicus]